MRARLPWGLHPGKPVAAGAFEKLLQGHVIGTRTRLGRLRDGQHEHRPGFDITFSAPKSVSLAALLPTEEHPHGDRAVIRAHSAAVRETLDWIEATLLETRCCSARGFDADRHCNLLNEHDFGGSIFDA